MIEDSPSIQVDQVNDYQTEFKTGGGIRVGFDKGKARLPFMDLGIGTHDGSQFGVALLLRWKLGS